MTDVKIFNSPMFGELRVTRNEKGELLFCLKDVCDSLGLQVGATVKRLGGDINSTNVPKGEHNHPYLSSINVGVVTGKKGDGTNAIQTIAMYFVTEPDLYRCIFQSRKPTARKFQDWVFNEVLPSLRTTGAYVVAKEEDSEEDIIARGLIAAKAALARREQRIKELECENSQSKQVIEVQSERIAKDAPKVEYYDQTLAAENMLTTRQIANELGITPNELHNKLQQLKIIFRQSNQWLMNKPYSTWKLHGTRTYTYYDRHKDVTYSKPYLVWNQRGRRFILALYKNNFNVKRAISDINGKTAK
jgi:prophage antirepressor-like protein